MGNWDFLKDESEVNLSKIRTELEVAQSTLSSDGEDFHLMIEGMDEADILQDLMRRGKND